MAAKNILTIKKNDEIIETCGYRALQAVMKRIIPEHGSDSIFKIWNETRIEFVYYRPFVKK